MRLKQSVRQHLNLTRLHSLRLRTSRQSSIQFMIRVRVLHSEVPVETAKARLRFYRAAAKEIFNCLLGLMGMSAPERM